MRLICLAAALALVLTSCRAPAPDLDPLCVPSYTSVDEPSGYQEIEFPASEGTLWALLVTPEGQFHARTPARILWKMSDGRGDLHLTAIHEDGTRIPPYYPPVSRSTRSAWKHEGQEWGSGFIFPKAGCWRILVTRWLLDTDRPVTGQVEIQVLP